NGRAARILRTGSRMRALKPIGIDRNRRQSPLQRAVAMALVPETDFLRLQAVARLYARDLPGDIGWRDLLTEAIARVLEGKRRRRRPAGDPAPLWPERNRL